MEIREQGYAIDREEFTLGVSCLSVPLADESIIALSLSAPSERFDEQFESYLEVIVQTARSPSPQVEDGARVGEGAATS